jgi:hypothetical protein
MSQLWIVGSCCDEHALSPYRHHPTRQRANGFLRASCEKNPAARHDRPTSASLPIRRRAPAPLWFRAWAREEGVSRRLRRFGGPRACWGALSSPSGLPAMPIGRASDAPSAPALGALPCWACSRFAGARGDCHSRSVKKESFHRRERLPSKGIEPLSPTWFPTKEDRLDTSPISRLRRRDPALDVSSRRCLPGALRHLRHRARPPFTTLPCGYMAKALLWARTSRFDFCNLSRRTGTLHGADCPRPLWRL